MKVNTSAMSNNQTDAWMLPTPRMRKQDQFKYGRDITELTKDGRLSILTRPDQRPLEWTEISDSISTDHSTLCRDFQPIEFLITTAATFTSSNGKWARPHNNGSSETIEFFHQSMLRPEQSKFRAQEEAETLDSITSILDGGRCSLSRTITLLT
jgi:hypothetical protein